jgi:hypothetical protein
MGQTCAAEVNRAKRREKKKPIKAAGTRFLPRVDAQVLQYRTYAPCHACSLLLSSRKTFLRDEEEQLSCG